MTYVREQTSAELRVHMKQLQAMDGWSNPLVDRLWEEVQKLERELQAARRTPAAESAAREAVIEECAVAAWSAGMDEYGPYAQLMDPRQVGSICAKRIRALKTAPTTEGEQRD